MVIRLFAYCKALIGIYLDPIQTETTAGTDSSTNNTEAPDLPDAEAATDVKPDNNSIATTTTTAANNDDVKVEQVNPNIASGSQQKSTALAALEAWHVAEIAKLQTKLATSNAKLARLAAKLTWAECVKLKKEEEHSRLYRQLSILHETYSRRHKEFIEQNQKLERVVEEDLPGAEMAMLLLYLSRAAVDISGAAKQDAERMLKQAYHNWEAYKRGCPFDGEGDASDAGGAEQDAKVNIKAGSEADIREGKQYFFDIGAATRRNISRV